MPFDPTGHIDGDDLVATLLDNLKANQADPEGFLEWEASRNEHAKAMPMDSPIPRPPPLNHDGSEQGDTDTQESEEPWIQIPDAVARNLIERKSDPGEPGFTGEIVDSLGRKRKFVNGKPVKRDGDQGTKQTWRARLDGEKVHVISHDPDRNLVNVKKPDGQVAVVKTGDLDFDRGGQKKASEASALPVQPTPITTGATYNPDPSAINTETGLADKARVGVPAMSSPPPPAEIGRLPNLSDAQRKVESRFADAFLANPEGMADKYLKALKKGKVGERPNIFATDDVKMLNPDWNPVEAGPDAVKKAMAENNAAVHQTANAIAKRAFVKYLDDVVAHMPASKRTVLVTNGGCASGKGSSLKHATDPADPHYGLLPAADQVGAVWDAAGEQNATENEWVLQECRKRGIKPIFSYVWADPATTWGGDDSRGVIRRAQRKGRMVDARLFADSYAVGAKNFKAFTDKHPEARFIYLDNRDKKAPKVMDQFPEPALQWDAEAIYRDAVAVLGQRKGDLDPALVAGGLIGTTIWGPPSKETRAMESRELDTLESGFTGEVVGKDGRKMYFRDGKPAKRGLGDVMARERSRAQIDGQDVHVLAHDAKAGLVKVKTATGTKIAKATDLEHKPANAKNQTETQAFKDWFGNSKIVDGDGKPLRVYRGEWGKDTANADNPFDAVASSSSVPSFTDNPMAADAYTVAGAGPGAAPGMGGAERTGAYYLSLQSPLDLDAFAKRDLPKGQDLIHADDVRALVRQFGGDHDTWWSIMSDMDFSTGGSGFYVSGGDYTWLGEGDEDLRSLNFDAAVPLKDKKLANVAMSKAGLAESQTFRDLASQAGHDGFVLTGALSPGGNPNAEKVTYKEFRPMRRHQIKSATGNRGTFDAKSDKIHESREH